RLLLLLLLRIVSCQVGRDALPGLAMIARTEKKLRADVDRSFLVRRERQRGIPVEAQFFLVVRLGLNDARFMRVTIHPADVSALILGINVIGVGWINESIETVAIKDIFPARVSDAA